MAGHEQLWLKLLTSQHRQVLPKVSAELGQQAPSQKAAPCVGRLQPPAARWLESHPWLAQSKSDHGMLGIKRKLAPYWDLMSPSPTIYFNNITHSGI